MVKNYFYELYVEVNNTKKELSLTRRRRLELEDYIVKNLKKNDPSDLINEGNELHKKNEELALKQTILFNRYTNTKNLLNFFEIEVDLVEKDVKLCLKYLKEIIKHYEGNEKYEKCAVLHKAVQRLME